MYRSIRICPHCGVLRFLHGENRFAEEIPANETVWCCRRHLSRRARGAWKSACTNFRESTHNPDFRDVAVHTPDTEDPGGTLVIRLCDECYANAFDAACNPLHMGAARPESFYGWCLD